MIKHHKGKIMILLLQNAIQYQAISTLMVFRMIIVWIHSDLILKYWNHSFKLQSITTSYNSSSGTTNIFILRESFCRLKSELISSRKNKSVRVRNNILVVLYLTFADFSIICLSAMCRIDETINLLNYFVTVQNK